MIMFTFSLSSVYAQLTSFANLENFWSLFDTAFGSSYDFAIAASFRSQWQGGDFSLFPQIEVVSSDVLGSAKGAYAISTNKIYLSDSFISSASQQSLEAVILEEFGHFVDAQVNSTDTLGDEGELFSALVRGVSLSAAELGRIQAEDDHAVIVVDGQSVAVEQAVTRVGSWDRLSSALAVTVVGNYAYAVGDTLEIIDISDPSNPIFKGGYDINNAGRDIQVVDNYAYIANDSGLQIIDISNPTAPTFKGSYNTYYGAEGVHVVGNYAYVAANDSELQIIDISNPTAPTLKGTYNQYLWGADDVQVVGNYAYVAASSSGLQIIDISNPTAPTLKGTYRSGSHWPNAVQVVGNYVYVTDAFSGLRIIDISNPTAPTLKGSYDTTGYAYDVQVVGNYAYVADSSSGLQIIDISNPTVPIFKGNYNTSDTAYDVQVVGNYAYVADSYSGLQIIDVSNPTVPILEGNYDISGYTHGVNDVQVVGNYAYAADGSSGLQIIDVSNPTVPIFKGSYDTPDSANNVQVVGNFAYIADSSGLLIVDISDPIAPTLKGSYDPNDYGYTDIHVVGNYAYLAATANSGSLSIIDISNPTSPILKGSSSGNTATNDVQVVGNYAYTANFHFGIRIIDVSNPNAPILKGSYDTPGWAKGVQVVGNYAYVADDSSGLQIIDISNPTAPIFKGSYDTAGDAYGVQVVGNYAYVADYHEGLQIIDITNPTAPILKGSYDTAGYAYGVQVVGNYAYVADGKSGLEIIDVSEFIPVNQAPSDLSLSNSTIAENQAIGTAVGLFTSTDPVASDSFTYSLVTGTGDTDNVLFVISGTQLQSNAVFDFETKNSYSIRVRTTDQGGLTFEKQLTIGVTNINETPTDLTLSNTSIAENQAVGTAIGTFTTTDPDTGNTFTYSLVTGAGSTDNALFAITGNQLQSNGIFNFETKNSYSIRVRTTNQGGLTFEKQLTIGVTNINETPTDLTLSNTSIAENQAVGTAIGTFTTTDPDTGNTFTYSLVTGTGSTDNALFAITGNQLRSNGIFDFETKNSYSIRVKTTDQGGLSYEKELTIGITNVDEQRSLSLTPQQDIFINEGLDDTVTGTFANLQQNDNINGGVGIDTLTITAGTTSNTVTINASNITNQLNISGTTIKGFERFDLSGFLGKVTYTGTTTNDWVATGAGADLLNGGAGVDTLIGGLGNDIYQVDSTSDIITENTNEGTDTIQSSVTFSLAALPNIENLTLQGTAISGTGNEFNNSITGNASNNILSGGSGNDVLNGSTGADSLIGGTGNDSYYIDNAGDSITELSGEGTDIVYSTIDYTLVGTYLENLTLQGTAINGTGNEFNNSITGNASNNILSGGAGNDVLNGGAGIDTLIGGLGNDTYTVDNVGDIVTETSTLATEIDTVNSSVTYSLLKRECRKTDLNRDS